MFRTALIEHRDKPAPFAEALSFCHRKLQEFNPHTPDYVKTLLETKRILTVGLLGIKAAGIIVRFNSASLTGINNWLSIAKPKFSDLLVI